LLVLSMKVDVAAHGPLPLAFATLEQQCAVEKQFDILRKQMTKVG